MCYNPIVIIAIPQMMGIHWYTPKPPGFLHGGQVPCSVPTGDPLGIPWGSKGHVPEVIDIP